VAEFQYEPRLLGETTPRQRGLYRAHLCLLAQAGALDVRTGAALAGEDGSAQGVEAHYLFPPGQLENAGVPASTRESALNRVLVSRQTRGVIGNRRPADYLPDFAAAGTAKLGDALEAQALPADPHSPLWRDPASLLAARERALEARVAALSRVGEVVR
jgi:hypothetical protein